jgi:hypothetical protein
VSDRRLVDVTSEIVIARPLSEVATFAADPNNVTRWYRNIESVEWRSSPPLAVGTRLAFVARFLGRRLAYTYEVDEFVPGERLVMRTDQGAFPMETTYTWEDAPAGGTLMALRNRGRPSGVGRIGAKPMTAAMRRANQKDLERLRSVLER